MIRPMGTQDSSLSLRMTFPFFISCKVPLRNILFILLSIIYFLKSNISILNTSLQQKFLIDMLAQFSGVIFFQPFPVIFGAFTNAIGELPDP